MQKVIYYSVRMFTYKTILWNNAKNAQKDRSAGSADGGQEVYVLVAS
jgi:hypothetical protein